LYLRTRLQQESTDPEHKRAVVKGLLIADRIRPGDEAHGKANQDAGIFDIRKWSNLLTSTEAMHEEFLKVVRLRAPPDDPRLQALPDDDAKSAKKAAGHRKKKKKKKATRRGRKNARD